MKVQRYRLMFNDGAFCLDSDVDRLEAINADLLEALQEVMNQTDGRNHSMLSKDRAYAIARAAIAKAEETKGEPT